MIDWPLQNGAGVGAVLVPMLALEGVDVGE